MWLVIDQFLSIQTVIEVSGNFGDKSRFQSVRPSSAKALSEFFFCSDLIFRYTGTQLQSGGFIRLNRIMNNVGEKVRFLVKIFTKRA